MPLVLLGMLSLQPVGPFSSYRYVNAPLPSFILVTVTVIWYASWSPNFFMLFRRFYSSDNYIVSIMS